MKNISTVTKVFFNLLYIYNFFFPSVIWLELFLALGVFPVQTQTCLCAATPQTQDAVVPPFGHRLTLNLMFYFHQSFGRSVETTPLTAEGRRNSAFGTACTRWWSSEAQRCWGALLALYHHLVVEWASAVSLLFESVKWDSGLKLIPDIGSRSIMWPEKDSVKKRRINSVFVCRI